MQQTQQLASLIGQAKQIVFFGGAGVSTESGIPDFRSAQGLFHQNRSISPETMLSLSFFKQHPDVFYQFYRENLLYPDAKPNDTHKALARLEMEGKLTCVITQNIDGLHQQAGSQKVIELHGTTSRYHCTKCKTSFAVDAISWEESVPRCDCGGLIKPDVVLYEEPLNEQDIADAIGYIQSCDLLIVGGTSLQVYPAAGFVRLCPGKLVIINRDATPFDKYADLLFHAPLGKTLRETMDELGWPISLEPPE